MADVVVTVKLMPESPDSDLADIEAQAKKAIIKFGGHVGKTQEVPIAFGLKAVNIVFVVDESKGSTEPLEKELALVDQVASAEITDVRRAIG